MKVCIKCKEEKDITCFESFTQKGTQYTRGSCRSCRHAEVKTKADLNREQIRKQQKQSYREKVENDKEGTSRYYRDWHLRKSYNITLEQYEALSEEQDNKCLICGEEEKIHKGLVVDHNHKTREVRGLLCQHCNAGLGLFRDSSDYLFAAFLYLKDKGSYVVS